MYKFYLFQLGLRENITIRNKFGLLDSVRVWYIINQQVNATTYLEPVHLNTYKMVKFTVYHRLLHLSIFNLQWYLHRNDSIMVQKINSNNLLFFLINLFLFQVNQAASTSTFIVPWLLAVNIVGLSLFQHTALMK